MVEWRGPDADGDWLLSDHRGYQGLLATREDCKGVWRFVSSEYDLDLYLNTTDLEEAKNIAFALWALNQ